MLNYQLFQKLKLLGNAKFNHNSNNPHVCGPKFPLNKWAQHMGFLTF